MEERHFLAQERAQQAEREDKQAQERAKDQERQRQWESQERAKDRENEERFGLRRLELQRPQAPPVAARRDIAPAFKVENAVRLIPRFTDQDLSLIHI